MYKRMRIKIIDEVKFCCKEMKDYYESHNDIRFDSSNCLMSYKNEMINICPFCEAAMEIDVSVAHWGGE